MLPRSKMYPATVKPNTQATTRWKNFWENQSTPLHHFNNSKWYEFYAQVRVGSLSKGGWWTDAVILTVCQPWLLARQASRKQQQASLAFLFLHVREKENVEIFWSGIEIFGGYHCCKFLHSYLSYFLYLLLCIATFRNCSTTIARINCFKQGLLVPVQVQLLPGGHAHLVTVKEM